MKDREYLYTVEVRKGKDNGVTQWEQRTITATSNTEHWRTAQIWLYGSMPRLFDCLEYKGSERFLPSVRNDNGYVPGFAPLCGR